MTPTMTLVGGLITLSLSLYSLYAWIRDERRYIPFTSLIATVGMGYWANNAVSVHGGMLGHHWEGWGFMASFIMMMVQLMYKEKE